jgi:hypothetical protein
MECTRQPPICRVLLSAQQAQQFWPILQVAQNETGISGLLCTVNSVNRFSSSDSNLLLALPGEQSSVLLELQVAKLDALTTRRIQELIRAAKEKHSN